MDDLHIHFFGQGLFAGLVIAVPVGPISILCIQRTIKQGFIAGLISGLGASTGDALYAWMGAFGLSFIAAELIAYKIWLSLLGGLFLCFLGIKTFHDQPSVEIAQLVSPDLASVTHIRVHQYELFKNYITTLLLDLINPMTILPFLAILTSLHALHTDNISVNSSLGSLFVLGVFLSGIIWRSLLSLTAGYLRQHLSKRQSRRINQVTGLSIALFGFAYVCSIWH